MTISAVSSSSNPLIGRLEANGLSESKAKLVDSDLQDAVKQTASAAASGSGPVSKASVRKALDDKIDADVKAGKLSADDAAAVKKTLDQMDQQSGSDGSSAPAKAGGAKGGGAGGGGGGGGGAAAAAKTEVSETVTVTGSTKTTVVTYSDKSTTTTTTTASDADVQKYAKASAAADTGGAAQDYLSSIEPGTLIDQVA